MRDFIPPSSSGANMHSAAYYQRILRATEQQHPSNTNSQTNRSFKPSYSENSEPEKNLLIPIAVFSRHSSPVKVPDAFAASISITGNFLMPIKS
ncbi:MAG: hypothetical protein ACXWEU_03785 [Methylomonas sp.]